MFNNFSGSQSSSSQGAEAGCLMQIPYSLEKKVLHCTHTGEEDFWEKYRLSEPILL
jgi:hypothetical protein